MINKKQVVTIAGNDSDGSAGMPADMHAFFTDDTYGMGLLTAAVAGNSVSIYQQQIMPADFVAKEFDVLAADFDISASKTGMLGNSAIIKVIADKYNRQDFGPLVVDPVIITKHGDFLLEKDAYADFQKLIIPLAEVITPNYFEAETLTGVKIPLDDPKPAMVEAAKKLQGMGAKNVVVKGPHESDDQKEVSDLLLTADGKEKWFTDKYVKTNKINGTGDTFSAIITAELAKGTDLSIAVKKAKQRVHAAIAHPLNIGSKFGPVNQWMK